MNKGTDGLSEKQKEDYKAYLNYKRIIDNPNYFKDSIYENIKVELDDIPFLKLQLGIFYNIYLDDICEKMNEFEKITLKHIEENNITGIPKRAILDLKSEVEETLSRLVNIRKDVVIKGKRGRKRSTPKLAVEYLRKFVSEIHKEKFISELKSQYQSSDHFTFNLLIRVLIDLGYIEPTTRVALKNSFEKALDRVKQSQQNFNKQFNQDLKHTIEYKSISNNIKVAFESSLTK